MHDLLLLGVVCSLGVPEVCEAGSPLVYENVSVFRAAPGSTFDFNTWSGTKGTSYTLSAKGGSISSTQPGGSVY